MKLSIIICAAFIAIGCSNNNSETLKKSGADVVLRSGNGDRVGNGGGVWTCKEASGDYRWIELVDLYEAEKEFNVSILKPQGDFRDLFNSRRFVLAKKNPKLYTQISSYLDNVITNHSIVESELKTIDDVLYRVYPRANECESGVVKFEQLANFTNYGNIIINKDIWNNPKFSDAQKAALLFHEAIYQWLREKGGDQNSTRTRVIVGYLFSDLVPREQNKVINNVLQNWGSLSEVESVKINPQSGKMVLLGDSIERAIEHEVSEYLFTNLLFNLDQFEFTDKQLVLSGKNYYDRFTGKRYGDGQTQSVKLSQIENTNVWYGQQKLEIKISDDEICDFIAEVAFIYKDKKKSEFWSRWPTISTKNSEGQLIEASEVKSCEDLILSQPVKENFIEVF